jgi:hypothetical protein
MRNSLSEWLALREAADWASRSERLVQRIQDALVSSATIYSLDLCTGTGSNLRYLMDRLRGRQRWLVVDRDAALLEEVPSRLSRWARDRDHSIRIDGRVSHIRGEKFDCEVETRPMNLEGLDAEIFEGRHLVTASALLDLVSESWLRVLASRCRAAGAAALFAITYDGRSSCHPVEPEDERIRQLLNLHQKTDKGLGGPAAGPEAWVVAEQAFEEAGYRIEVSPSDWSLDSSEQVFQRMLIEGWAQAAREMAPQEANAIADWLRRRLAHVNAGRSHVVVHHVDMAAWLV